MKILLLNQNIDAQRQIIAYLKQVGIGVLSGDQTLRLPGAFAISEVELTPTWTAGVFELTLPIRSVHREPFESPLRQTDLDGSFAVDVEPLTRFHLGAQAGAALTTRPGWPDLLQPNGVGTGPALLPTDRFSHVDAYVRGKLQAIPLRHHHARLKVSWMRRSYTHDPAFDAFVRPNHLTPNDRDEWTGDVSWRYIAAPLRLGIAVGASRHTWFYAFARDAHTGATHAGAGGAPPNPLQVLHTLDVEPSAELVLQKDRLSVRFDWRVRAVDDMYQGYYSALENRLGPSIDATLGPAATAVRIEGSFSGMYRLYTAAGYAPGATHPSLDDGSVRDDRAAQWDLDMRFPARAPLALVLHATARLRRTNFPDYQSGVFPSVQPYDVDWDYQQGKVWLGLTYALDSAQTGAGTD